ncbi:aldehyde dehydrogenase family protein [Nocardiopsis baichengensis]|uniref:aldehyde dehydrogenase family protein n=1 Tax=Nocardiopsis baichengensis TaxID=280240 RepID=UPI00034CA876|nr:aldehyde dehydrogenase family protein [Nocardiopsis baichengensis]
MSLLDPAEFGGRVFTGEWSTPRGGATSVTSPATGEELARIGFADAEDVAASAAHAADAQRAWAAASFEERAAVLRRAGALFEEHTGQVAGWLVGEAGSAQGKAAFETHLAVTEAYESAALASQPAGEVLRTAKPRLSMSRRVPAGVVGVISPFNFPLILAMRSVAPALALGNAVVLKPDPRTAVCGGAVIAEVFRRAGLPEGVLHVLPGGAEAGERLVADPRVRVVSFTGSTAAGRRVGEAAGRHLKRVHLELGGNSPLVVLGDADVGAAASAGAWGAFLHQGQICMTTGRHIVHSSIAEEYTALLAAKADALAVGDPAQDPAALGPLIDAGQRDRVHGLVARSVEAGARLRAGGVHDGLFYRPTVLDRVGPDVPAYGEEVFGPVAPVIAFDTEEEAVELASAGEYGLSLGVLTGNPMRGMELAERIPAGLVHINDQTVDDEATAPFGGVGASGTGSRFGGTAANVEAFTETQWVTMQTDIQRYPF